MGASTRENTQPSPLNGTTTIKGEGKPYFREKDSSTEFQIVAAKLISTTKHPMDFEMLWRLELADGSTVQWAQRVSHSYYDKDQSIHNVLADLPDQRPAKKAEERFRFGIMAEETKEMLLRLGNGIGETVLLQSVTEMTVNSTDDFEIRMLSVLYAEKRT